jgi:hypothetical protein
VVKAIVVDGQKIDEKSEERIFPPDPDAFFQIPD